MRVLGIDTSSSAVSVAIGEVGEAVGAGVGFREVAGNRHGELLASLIDLALAETALRPGDFGAIAVGLGPGPFTGLRVGIMTAKAMGDALGVPVYGECSLDLIRHPDATPFAALSDARRKQVYWAEYDSSGNRSAGPELNTPADVAELLRGRVEVLVGAGAAMYREPLEGFRIEEEWRYPEPSNLFGRINDRAIARAPSDDLTPLYLRRPDARPPGKPKTVTPT